MRHSLRLATFLIGVWFGGLLLISMAVTNSFRAIEELMQSPEPQAERLLNKLGPEDGRLLLRHAIAENNRRLFTLWGIVQLGLAGTLMIYLLFGTNTGRISLALAFLMLTISFWMQWKLIPRIGAISRTLDFDRAATQGPAGIQFRHLHQIFGLFEMAILILGTILLARFLRNSRIRRPSEADG